MLIRLTTILFPLFFIVLLGFLVGRRTQPDLAHANRLNMDVFVPALIFAALANKDFHIADYLSLSLATLLLIALSGIIGWLLARISKTAPKTLMPSIMFNNCGNLGIPLAVLAFGQEALAPAIVMFAISNLLHFSFGCWLLDHHIRLRNIWRTPSVFAALAGVTISLLHIELWPPLMQGIKMLGDISIPLMLFALGVRLTQTPRQSLRLGILVAIARPVSGMLLAGLLSHLLDLPKQEAALLLIFGALPPAVLNYMFAEHYRQEPDKVASMVLAGNLASPVFLPIALIFTLA